MGDKVFNSISITGFSDEAAREAFREAAAKGAVPFSLERLLPLPEPEEIELEEMRLFRELYPEESASRSGTDSSDEKLWSSIELGAVWGTWIYEWEGNPECVNNRVEQFTVGKELGLEYHFDSRNDPSFMAIRHISHRYPDLLFKMRSENVVPSFFYLLYKKGERFFAGFDEDEFIHTRASEWPMIAALSPEHWRDESLHTFVRSAVENLAEDTTLEEDAEKRRNELRRDLHTSVENMQKRLKERKGKPHFSVGEDVPF